MANVLSQHEKKWTVIAACLLLALGVLVVPCGATPAEVSVLIEQLGSDDRSVRREAQKKLVQIGEPAVAALIEALRHHQDPRVRAAAAADALGRVGNERAVDPLKETREHDESVMVRRAATEALRKLQE